MTHDTASLSRAEAEARASLLTVQRYDIDVDLTGLLEGDTLRSVSTITFTCAEPGASTFVDCVAEIDEATLNGVRLDVSPEGGAARGRLPLSDLAADNVLVVAARQSETGRGAGIMRTVDSVDKLVYVWTSFEPDDARRLWACFDQPDLKAPHRFTVTAPESWTVTSNRAPESVTEGDVGERVWAFPDTPPLSTYVVVVNAGPFHQLRRSIGGHDLGLFSRQSTARFLDRDADELFEVTSQGLAHYADRFGSPFGQERYDQVFVPNMGGAMENWGCVTWSDTALYRSTPTYDQRARRAEILLHEMAHMWFGDLVTMRWWDDLWLNEAFATWASLWCMVGATEFTGAWEIFLAAYKFDGYQLDLSPATHPIRAEVPDVAQAMANFDTITYEKGAAVLKQLAAHVGEDAFVAGLRSYFAEHAWGNTTLQDLMSAVEQAAGTDLSGWTTAWLDRAGPDVVSLQGDQLVVSSPDADPPRPHTMVIGSYAVADASLRHVARTLVTTGSGPLRVELPEADLHLLNDEDLTFVVTEPDAGSRAVLATMAGELPTPMARAVAVTDAAISMLRGGLRAEDVMRTVLGVLGRERSAPVVEPFLALARECAEAWAPLDDVAAHLLGLAEVSTVLADDPELRRPALRMLAATATTPEHFALLGSGADDVDLQWRVLTRQAELGELDEAAVSALLERDPDPEARTRAIAARAAQPSADAKEQTWAAVFTERSVHVGTPMRQVASAFWRPGQVALEPYPVRFLEEIGSLGTGSLLEQGALVRMMFPPRADEAFLERAARLAADASMPPMIRAEVTSSADLVSRRLRTQRPADDEGGAV